jgi:hypothetical protein
MHFVPSSLDPVPILSVEITGASPQPGGGTLIAIRALSTHVNWGRMIIQEVRVRGYVSQVTSATLAAFLASAAGAASQPAAKPPEAPIQSSLKKVSTQGPVVQLPQRDVANARRDQAATPSNTSFFKTRKGAVALGLMASGVVFTVGSINHDRKPVKSPVR